MSVNIHLITGDNGNRATVDKDMGASVKGPILPTGDNGNRRTGDMDIGALVLGGGGYGNAPLNDALVTCAPICVEHDVTEKYDEIASHSTMGRWNAHWR